jgi:tripartite ATP-independent transporter DctM subunit
MIIVGFIGMWDVNNLMGAMANVGQTAFDAAINYELSVVPLFVLMGNFVTRARLSEELYTASNAFLGHRKGGLAMATIVACGGFAAVCGSSLATAATMSKVAMPSMRRYGYDDGLAAGAIAAGGTLGILIPPSVLLVIYGILTQTNIGKLFAAGIVPGLVGVLFYMLAVRAVITIWPELGPRGEKTDWAGRIAALKGVWGVLLLFAIVMGGIYGGVFTPTEAAGIGALGSFFFFLSRKETWRRLVRHLAAASIAGTIVLAVLLVLELATGGFPEDVLLQWIVAGLLVTGAPAALFAITGRRSGEGEGLPLGIVGPGVRLGAILLALCALIAMAGASMGSHGLAGTVAFLRVSGVYIAAVVIIAGLVGQLLFSTKAWGELYETLLESAATTAMLFTVLIGALLFANFINFTTFPQALLGIAEQFRESPWLVLIAILGIYVLLGCVFESLSMILLTVPIFFPLIKELGPGFGLNPIEVSVWYGIVVVVITEISLITPPVGLNVFVLRGVLPDVRTSTIFRGVTAYWIADLFRLGVIVAFPILSLWLPQFVK